MSEQFFDVQKLRRRPKTRARVVAWIEALRSGEYKRATGTLRKVKGDAESFCCLGVACDLADPKWEGTNYHDLGHDGNFLSVAGTELYALGEGLDEGSAQRRLSDINDNKHGSFKRIARKLEKAYEAALA